MPIMRLFCPYKLNLLQANQKSYQCMRRRHQLKQFMLLKKNKNQRHKRHWRYKRISKKSLRLKNQSLISM